MGVSSSPAKFVLKVNELTKVPERVALTAVRVNAKNAGSNAEKSVRSATNGSGRLRNAGALVRAPGAQRRVVGRKGARLRVSTRVAPGGQFATIKALGPWQLIEYPTVSHEIGPSGQTKDVLAGPTLSGRKLKSKSGRAGAKGRQGRAKALRTPYGLKRRVYVKGTKGKFPWRAARLKTYREAPLAIKKAATAELAKVFR